eukprot:6483203-Pyramimonas_sp.AAC.1
MKCAPPRPPPNLLFAGCVRACSKIKRYVVDKPFEHQQQKSTGEERRSHCGAVRRVCPLLANGPPPRRALPPGIFSRRTNQTHEAQ